MRNSTLPAALGRQVWADPPQRPAAADTAGPPPGGRVWPRFPNALGQPGYHFIQSGRFRRSPPFSTTTRRLVEKEFRVLKDSFKISNPKAITAAETVEETARLAARLIDLEAARLGGNRELAVHRLSEQYGFDPGELVRVTQPSRKPKRVPPDFALRTRMAYLNILETWAGWLRHEIQIHEKTTSPDADLLSLERELAAIETKLRAARRAA